MKVKVLKAEGKGKKKGSFIGHLILMRQFFNEITDYLRSEGIEMRDLWTVCHLLTLEICSFMVEKQNCAVLRLFRS